MSHRSVVRVCVAVALIALGSVAAGAQGVGSSAASPRTPWGEPDLQGLWTSATLTPLERPRRLADKTALTDEEAAAMERQTIENWAASWVSFSSTIGLLAPHSGLPKAQFSITC